GNDTLCLAGHALDDADRRDETARTQIDEGAGADAIAELVDARGNVAAAITLKEDRADADRHMVAVERRHAYPVSQINEKRSVFHVDHGQRDHSIVFRALDRRSDPRPDASGDMVRFLCTGVRGAGDEE